MVDAIGGDGCEKEKGSCEYGCDDFFVTKEKRVYMVTS